MHQATVTFRLAIKVVHDGRHIILTGSSSRQLYKEMADNQQKEGAQPKEDAGEKSPATVTICSHHCSHPYCACCPAKPPPKPQTKPSTKADPALEKRDMLRMVDLGLGRGIDATDPKPWGQQKRFSSPSHISEKRPGYGRRRLAAELRP